MSARAILAVAAAVVFAGVGSLTAQRGSDSADSQMPPGRERAPIPSSEREKRILDVLDRMVRGPYSGILSVPPEDGRLLRLLAEAAGAKHVVEIGTSNGYASIWFCLALRTTGGRLTTYEIDPDRASLARENFKRAGVDTLVTLIEGNAHETVQKLRGPIDIVFIDADKDGYLDYLNKLLPLVRPGGLILAHNTTDVASQMEDYLEAVTTNAELETIFLHKRGSGIGVTLKKRRHI
ncbi:MAG: O-methyltransferase [Phycisphaerales bacterium]|nr:MAG: O-methyltransferase [Phycisphaerales bacterium]